MRHHKPFAQVLVAAVAAVGALAVGAPVASGQASTACPVTATDQAVDAEEQQVLNLINQYRQANGRSALTMHTGVTRAAAWFSRDMATKNYFPPNHVDSLGRAPDQRMQWCGVSFTNWAENIYAGSPTAQDVFNAWRNSPGHNANMLRDGVTAAGIARAYNANSTYRWYWTLDVTNSSASSPTTTVAPVTTTTRPATVTTTTAPWWTTTTTRPTTTTTRPPATTVAPTTTTRPAVTTTVAPVTTTTVPWWYCYYTRTCA